MAVEDNTESRPKVNWLLPFGSCGFEDFDVLSVAPKMQGAPHWHWRLLERRSLRESPEPRVQADSPSWRSAQTDCVEGHRDQSFRRMPT